MRNAYRQFNSEPAGANHSNGQSHLHTTKPVPTASRFRATYVPCYLRRILGCAHHASRMGLRERTEFHLDGALQRQVKRDPSGPPRPQDDVHSVGAKPCTEWCRAKKRLIATPPSSEIAITLSKHTDIPFSNRDSDNPVGISGRRSGRSAWEPVPFWESAGPQRSPEIGPERCCWTRGLALSRLFSSSNVTSKSTPAPGHPISNRNSAETEFAVTLTKQTTVVLSNRNKKPPPRGGTTLQRPPDSSPSFNETQTRDTPGIRRGGRLGAGISSSVPFAPHAAARATRKCSTGIRKRSCR
jgi:hypothetical protein